MTEKELERRINLTRADIEQTQVELQQKQMLLELLKYLLQQRQERKKDSET